MSSLARGSGGPGALGERGSLRRNRGAEIRRAAVGGKG